MVMHERERNNLSTPILPIENTFSVFFRFSVLGAVALLAKVRHRDSHVIVTKEKNTKDNHERDHDTPRLLL